MAKEVIYYYCEAEDCTNEIEASKKFCTIHMAKCHHVFESKSYMLNYEYETHLEFRFSKECRDCYEESNITTLNIERDKLSKGLEGQSKNDK